jgi:hypothetical protein
LAVLLLIVAAPAEAQWSSTRGSVTSGGRYTAPAVAGPDRVVFRHNGFADTTTIAVGSTGGGTVAGIPFGHFKEPAPGAPLRSGGDVIVPQGQLANLPAIKARNGRVIVNVVGGGKCSLDAAGQWQMALWQACWKRNLTAANRDTVLAYAASGTVVGDYLIDEPNLVNRWGTIKPSDVCAMATFARTELPGVPVIVRAAPEWLGTCTSIDAAWAQYGSRRGVPATDYRDAHLSAAAVRGYALVFSLNGLNDDAAGTAMTPAQVTEYGTALLAGKPCLFMVWEYATTWSERPDIKPALDSLGRLAATLPATSCRRPM